MSINSPEGHIKIDFVLGIIPMFLQSIKDTFDKIRDHFINKKDFENEVLNLMFELRQIKTNLRIFEIIIPMDYYFEEMINTIRVRLSENEFRNEIKRDHFNEIKQLGGNSYTIVIRYAEILVIKL